MGVFAFYSGLSAGLFDAAAKWAGRMPGGLAVGTIAACAGFGAICGSGAATCATIGMVALPEMKKRGYSDRLSCGCVAAGAGLGVLIPPSVIFILYGIATGLSIGKLFISGIMPGIMLATMMAVTVIILVKRNPSLAPQSGRYSMMEKRKSLRGIIAMVIMFAIVIGGMFIGVFTSNEAAAIGSLASFIFMIVSGHMSFQNLKMCLLDTLKTFSMVYLILIGAQMLGYFLAVGQLPTTLANAISSLDVSPHLIFAVIVLIYAFLGCIMDGVAMILLTVPIFYPIILDLGFDGIWFGNIIVLVGILGGITPPVGISAYVIAGIAKDVSLATVFRGIVPFIFTILAGVAVLWLFPGIALWLPGLMKM
jgi:tripartite ATP-independent transporter DctM subunit